jgi:hypothetical protein
MTKPTNITRFLVAFTLCATCASCSKPNPQLGPNYSTVPCNDNCGKDTQCLSKCQPTSNSPSSPGFTPRRP